jgi:hypothetical protein
MACGDHDIIYSSFLYEKGYKYQTPIRNNFDNIHAAMEYLDSIGLVIYIDYSYNTANIDGPILDGYYPMGLKNPISEEALLEFKLRFS